MADRVKTRITDADLLALGDVKAEVRNGELIVYPITPNKIDHGAYNGNIHLFLAAFVKARNLGRVFTEMTAFNLEVDSEGGIKGSVAPDVSFVSFERLAVDAPLDVIARVAPDLAVEVTSDSDSYDDVLDKVAYYLNHDVTQVWIVSPKLHEVRVYAPDNRAGTPLSLNDELRGIGLLKDFRIPIRAIFVEDNALQVEVLRRLLGA